MIKKWLLSNLIGVIITTVVLLTTFGLVFSLANKDKITTRPDNIQLRTGPGVQYKSKTSLHSGTSLLIIKKSNGWYKVRRTDNEKTGWIASWVAKSKSLKTATPISEATIVLDPGHGGSDVGSLSANGKHFEKVYTLKTARVIRASLEKKGARIIMTRDSDVLVPLLYIPRMSSKYNADTQISIHFDHAGDKNSATQASGTTTYYYHKDSKQLANALSTELKNLPINSRGVDTAPYVVLNHAKQPSALLELGYINNKSNFKLIRSSTYQSKIAKNVTNGLVTYFNQIANKK